MIYVVERAQVTEESDTLEDVNSFMRRETLDVSRDLHFYDLKLQKRE